MSYLINTLLFLSASFLILLVLVQRGRGGGLAGALGGMGGQSAFGTKAGDVFTKVTIIVAAIWILLCAAAVKYYRPSGEENPFAGVPGSAAAQPQSPGGAAPAPEGTAPATGGAATGGSSAPAANTPVAPTPTASGTGS